MLLGGGILRWGLAALQSAGGPGTERSPRACGGMGEGTVQAAGPGRWVTQEEWPVPITHTHDGTVSTVSLKSEESATGSRQADLDGHRKHRHLQTAQTS